MPWVTSLFRGLLVVALAVTIGAMPIEAKEARDPFLFGPREAASASGQPQLTGILSDPVTPLAAIDGELLGVGAVVAGWTIVEIGADQVIFERDGRRETLLPGAFLPSE